MAEPENNQARIDAGEGGYAPPPFAEDGAEFLTRLHESNGQQSLFDQSDLVLPPNLRSFRKSVAAVYAVPSKAETSLSLQVRRLMDASIVVAQLDCKKRGQGFIQKVVTERVSPIFEVRVSELSQLAGIPGKNYERIYENLDELFEMVMRWNILGEEKGTDFEMRSHFFSMLGVGKESKRGLIRFSIDPSVLEILMEPSIWASLSLGVLRDLKTSPSYALYQAVWRYVNVPSKLTASLPTYTWIEIMLGQCRYVVKEPNGTKTVTNYSEFKRRYLMDAIERINKVPALAYTLELKEIKSGPRVVRLQFKFVPKVQPPLGLVIPWPEQLMVALRTIGLTDKDIQDIAEASSQELVSEALFQLKISEDKKKKQGLPMFNRRRYFEGILANISAGADAASLKDEDIEQKSREIENVSSQEHREKVLNEKFEAHVRQRFIDGLSRLEPEHLQRLRHDHEKSEAGARTLKQLSSTKLSAEGNLELQRSRIYLQSFRAWMNANRLEDYQNILPEPQDRSFNDWLLWRASTF